MSIDKYLDMQFNHYEHHANRWSLQDKNPVVGGYEKHNNWPDYDTHLFKDFDTTSLIAIDYGTGPGRNIIKFNDRFRRIDGVDIGKKNIENAKKNLQDANIDIPNLYVCNGAGTSIENNTYDVWFSVIVLQHIACYDIRYKILQDAYRILKPNGYICFQMGYGGRDTSNENFKYYAKKHNVQTANYYDNPTDAITTNGMHDCTVNDKQQVVGDLENIGFSNIIVDIRPTGPGCSHKNWIYVQGQKPDLDNT
jgi:ubiquinone/menaquinone biosynthesis C-methylase UbiE